MVQHKLMAITARGSSNPHQRRKKNNSSRLRMTTARGIVTSWSRWMSRDTVSFCNGIPDRRRSRSAWTLSTRSSMVVSASCCWSMSALRSTRISAVSRSGDRSMGKGKSTDSGLARGWKAGEKGDMMTDGVCGKNGVVTLITPLIPVRSALMFCTRLIFSGDNRSGAVRAMIRSSSLPKLSRKIL